MPPLEHRCTLVNTVECDMAVAVMGTTFRRWGRSRRWRSGLSTPITTLSVEILVPTTSATRHCRCAQGGAHARKAQSIYDYPGCSVDVFHEGEQSLHTSTSYVAACVEIEDAEGTHFGFKRNPHAVSPFNINTHCVHLRLI